MTTPLRRPIRRPNMRRAVILFPSGFTLGNLFFGIFAIIAASRLEFTAAGVYVLLGGICDALDGRVARATNSGTEFGEELDSLVDAISFGLAPAMIMYFAVLNRDGWDWIFVFAFAACAVLRLARFNIEQAGTAKTYFQGLPSPAAGITLASYYWFSQSWLYDYGAIADLKWHVLLRFIIAGLSMLMISNVPYPTFPRTGFRSLRAIGASLLVVGAIALLASRRLEYFFPISLIYVVWGLARWVFGGLFERRQPTLPYDLSEGEEDDDDDDEEFDIADSRVHASRQGHREVAATRQDVSRGRGRLDRMETQPTTSRGERASRKPDRPERPDRPDRTERTERPERAPGVDRGSDADRTARREKKQDRSKRGERPDRAERSERSERPPRPPKPQTESVVAPPVAPSPAPSPVSGVDAITLGAPAAEPMLDDEELTTGGDDVLEPEDGGGAVASGEPGAPTRKRKRRRRGRGDRKERGGADASASAQPPLGLEGIVTPGTSMSTTGEHDQSPYAPATPLPGTPVPSESSMPGASSAPGTPSAPSAPSNTPSSSEPTE